MLTTCEEFRMAVTASPSTVETKAERRAKLPKVESLSGLDSFWPICQKS